MDRPKNPPINDFLFGSVSSDGEQRIHCPYHEDKVASASINWIRRKWHCFSCKRGGSLSTLLAEFPQKESEPLGIIPPQEDDNPFADSRLILENGTVENWHDWLLNSFEGEELLDRFMEARALSMDTIKERKIGYYRAKRRYTIPVFDRVGDCTNVRLYSLTQTPKMINLKGYGKRSLYPIENLNCEEILLVEGELDALIACQFGFNGLSFTCGAGSWNSRWNSFFEGKTLYINFDNDTAGQDAAQEVAKQLHSIAKVYLVPPLLPDIPKSDITDWAKRGGTAEQLRDILHKTTLATSSLQGKRGRGITVMQSMNSALSGVPFSMRLTVVGRHNPTLFVPSAFKLTCNASAGAQCMICPMQTEWSQEHKEFIDYSATPDFLLQVMDTPESQFYNIIRNRLALPKCNCLRIEKIAQTTVEELFVMDSLDLNNDSDYTNRQLWNIGAHDTRSNTDIHVAGTVVPNPKTHRSELVMWKSEPSQVSIDLFKMTDEIKERLSVFQPAEDQTPIAKCYEIAQDLSTNVTSIVGREDMHIGFDLVYHSVLGFNLAGVPVSRGWLEFLVIGDTRTGKSIAAEKLQKYYGLGKRVTCESASFAGLVGGDKQLGNGHWTVSWGEIPLNDRRLVILDEASGLSKHTISLMSGIRTSGIAEVVKIEGGTTKARCRLIWISNPRKDDDNAFLGVDLIEALIGNPEDISRFDFAMSVSTEDVSSEIVNSVRIPSKPKYAAEDCQNLILWAWSRTPEQVRFTEDGLQEVFRRAIQLGNTFVDSPPLIQSANVREKIARIAVAIAARTFSCDESGEEIIVTSSHVRDAAKYINFLYSKPKFGYKKISKAEKISRRIANESTESFHKLLRDYEYLYNFFINRRTSFRSSDLLDLGVAQNELSHVISTLYNACLITKNKAQFSMTPEMRKALEDYVL